VSSALPVASGRRIRAEVARDAGRGWIAPAATLLVTIAGAVVGLAVPGAIGWITQLVVDRAEPAALLAPAGLLAGAALASALLGWAEGILLARAVLPPLGRLRERVVAAVVRMPLERVEAGGRGDLVARVSGDVERITEAASFAIGGFLSAAVTIVVTLVGLAGLDWRFGLAALLAVPIQLVTLRWYLRRSRPVYARGRAAEGRRAAALLETFAALPTIRAFRLGPGRARIAADASQDAADAENAATRIATRFFGRLNIAEFVGLAAVLAVGAFLVPSHEVTVGAATAAGLFFVGLFDPVNTALAVVDELQQASAGLARLVGVIAAADDDPPAPARGDAAAVLEARGLRFRYADGADVLHGIDVRVPRDGVLAIVGASGSGKSTLAALLAGVRIPTAGTVSAPPGVAMVSQEVHLFAGTLADDLRLARRDASDDALAAVLDRVGATAWVAALPDGLATPVGAGGFPIPADRAQQLALARILLLDPPYVVLDEATAEAGSGAARDLDRAAAEVVRGRGAVVVAHRLDQAATADEIVVLDAGRIVERGRHDALVAAGGRYARLWGAWSRSRPEAVR
jgi:ABC-type multidrug transport system fused ATPase/permease subunit